MAAEEPGKITDLDNLPEDVSLIRVSSGLYRMVDTEDLRRLSRIRLQMEMENKQEDFRLKPLTQGKFAIVDVEDYDRLARHKWCTVKGRDTFYAQRIHLGDFADKIQAALAYDDKAIELFGEFAYLNFPEKIELRNWIRKIIWAA